MQAVMKVSNAKNNHPAEINMQTVEVCGESAINEGNVRKRCRLFEEIRTSL